MTHLRSVRCELPSRKSATRFTDCCRKSERRNPTRPRQRRQEPLRKKQHRRVCLLGGIGAGRGRAAQEPGHAGGPLAPEPADKEDAFQRVISAAAFLRREDPYSYYALPFVARIAFRRIAQRGIRGGSELLEAPSTEIRQSLKKAAHGSGLATGDRNRRNPPWECRADEAGLICSAMGTGQPTNLAIRRSRR